MLCLMLVMLGLVGMCWLFVFIVVLVLGVWVSEVVLGLFDLYDCIGYLVVVFVFVVLSLFVWCWLYWLCYW